MGYYAMVPLATLDPDGATHQRFQNRSYELFRNHYYTTDEDMPDTADASAPYGFPVAYDTNLININQLST
jgi:hypothetical protein